MATPNDHTKKDTKILDCVCESDYQDKRYGKGKRVHNPGKENKYTCTVCGRKESQ